MEFDLCNWSTIDFLPIVNSSDTPENHRILSFYTASVASCQPHEKKAGIAPGLFYFWLIFPVDRSKPGRPLDQAFL